jgi:putative ABC transport system permease protein
LVAAGCVLGLVAGGVLSSVVSGLLFGVGRLDPLTYVTWPVLVTAIAALASYAAAARASSVSPSEALRAE